jgi:Holliday junction resolvase RusA-like endonuclease
MGVVSERRSIAFIVPGEPQGKGRARIGRIAGHARMFTPSKTAAYEGLVAMCASAAVANGPGRPLDGPLRVEIEATHTIPASWSKKRRMAALCGEIHPTSKPDIDNIAKAVADGGNGVAWVDDKQIVRLTMTKRYGEVPGVAVVATALP